MNKKELLARAYDLRFEIFFSTQLAILFGSLVVPLDFYEKVLSPALFLFNLGAGLLFISQRRVLVRIFMVLFLIALFVFGWNFVGKPEALGPLEYVRLSVYFLFYIAVTIEIIKQVWRAEKVSKNVIMGLMSGYIAIGLVGFFLFLTIEIVHPGSFGGLLFGEASVESKMDSLLYYSYITLLTIGYGEIFPATAVAQKAAILIGLAGQFYLVIITAVVVEKYIRHRQHKA